MPIIKHIIFLLNLIAFISGLAACLMLFLTWLRIRSKNLAYYLIIFSMLYVIALFTTLYIYIDINLPQIIPSIIYFYYSFIIIDQSVIFYCLLLLFHTLLKLPVSLKRQSILILFSVLPVLYNLFALINAQSVKDFVGAFDQWFIVSSIILFLFLMIFLLNIKKIKNKTANSFYSRIIHITIIYYSILLITIICLELLSSFSIFIYYLDKLYFSVFFTIHNIGSVFFCIKYFSKKFDSLESSNINNDFIEKYRITSRETEIIELVVAGKSNSEIAVNLNLTEGTVKVFLYNIFQKTGVKNRTSLVHKAKG